MPVFEYIGVNKLGKKVGGIVDADSDKAARVKLRKMDVFPTSLSISGAARSSRMVDNIKLGNKLDLSKFLQRIKTQDIALMTRQLATLVSAGIPLVESLAALIDQVENVKLRKIITSVKEKVTEGTKMSDALRAHRNVFSDLYINMINAGESSGALDIVLNRLADFTESQARLKNKVIGALIYPAIMSAVGVLLMVMMLIFVVPKITTIFQDVNAVLPLPTRILIGMSSIATNYWYIVIILIGLGVYGLRKYLKTAKGREAYDRYALRLPVLGKLLTMMTVSRFSRTLGTLLSSGVPMLAAMDIVRSIVSNTIIRDAIEKTKDSVREGESVAEPLKRSNLFPPMVIHMIAVGEKTGELERMLERIADTYDVQVDNTVTAMTSLLEPVMILVMASAVAFVVMSILLPILQLNQLGV